MSKAPMHGHFYDGLPVVQKHPGIRNVLTHIDYHDDHKGNSPGIDAAHAAIRKGNIGEGYKKLVKEDKRGEGSGHLDAAMTILHNHLYTGKDD